MTNENNDLSKIIDAAAESASETLHTMMGSISDSEPQAIVEQLIEGEWVPIGYEPTPEQIEAVRRGEPPPDRSEMKLHKFRCRHEAADWFSGTYSEWAKAELLAPLEGGKRGLYPPLSEFRIRELREGE